MQLPCENCISFALCRTTYIHYDNTLNQEMKLRMSLSKCKPLAEYLYTETLALTDLAGRNFTTSSLSETRLKTLLCYFDNYQYEEQYEITM